MDSVKAYVKEQVVKWLSNKDELGLTQGLTVMPKKVFYKYVAKSRYAVDGKVFRHFNKDELEKANTRLVHLINKLVLKNAYARNGRKLISMSYSADCRELIALSSSLSFLFILAKDFIFSNKSSSNSLAITL